MYLYLVYEFLLFELCFRKKDDEDIFLGPA